jgi:hypothetical protein
MHLEERINWTALPCCDAQKNLAELSFGEVLTINIRILINLLDQF